MAEKTSLEAITSRLEAQIAFDREREAFHTGQEAYHRDQRALYLAELEKLTAVLEAFQAAAATAAELSRRAPASIRKPSLDIGKRPSLTRMIRRVIETRPAGETFGANLLAAEINRHYRDRLRRPAQAKLVSLALRRMHKQGELLAIREGKPHHEALYARVEK